MPVPIRLPAGDGPGGAEGARNQEQRNCPCEYSAGEARRPDRCRPDGAASDCLLFLHILFSFLFVVQVTGTRAFVVGFAIFLLLPPSFGHEGVLPPATPLVPR